MQRPNSEFRTEIAALEDAYLRSDDPLLQSGYGGGRARWCAERPPLVDAIDRDGDFLGVGCANGLLAADVVAWAGARGHRLVPHGIDVGPRLITLARERHAEFAGNFETADAWTFRPDRHWTFVYSLLDLSPSDLTGEWLRLLYSRVAPGGRLIVGSYGSLSRRRPPEPVYEVLEEEGSASPDPRPAEQGRSPASPGCRRPDSTQADSP